MIREIRHPAPIVEFGLYRLLIAFLLDSFILAEKRPLDLVDIEELMEAGRFDCTQFDVYIDSCGDVFDLFHPERPFLQDVIMNGKKKPVSGLYPVTPSGTNAGLWNHQHEQEVTMFPAEAACLLTTIAPFMTSGGAGLSPSINGAPAIYALPNSDTLYATLLQNLPVREQGSGGGMIAWRNSRTPGGDRSEATTVEALTWRPRRVQFLPDISPGGHIVIRQMKFEKGDSTRLTWTDPNLAYRYAKDEARPIRMREGRPLWRDAGALSLLGDQSRGKTSVDFAIQRPDVVQQAFEIEDGRQELKIVVYGMRTDMKMKVFEWARSTWVVPSKLGRSTRLGAMVQQELDRAEQADYALRSAIKACYPREGAGNKGAFGSIVSRATRAYWGRLEHHFQPLMSTFASLDPDALDEPEKVKDTAISWRKAIQNIAISQFDSSMKDLDTDSDALERFVLARGRLNRKLGKVLL
tara:strand:- start:572 stop:1969 length:1398 start_codon:yes stop_codon:yes gene_type:complete